MNASRHLLKPRSDEMKQVFSGEALGLLVAGLCVLTAAFPLAQTVPPRLPPASPNPPAASLQAPLDPDYAGLIAT